MNSCATEKQGFRLQKACNAVSAQTVRVHSLMRDLVHRSYPCRKYRRSEKTLTRLFCMVTRAQGIRVVFIPGDTTFVVFLSCFID